MSKSIERSPEFIELLKRSGSSDERIACSAQREFAKAVELLLRDGVLSGDITSGIFESITLEGNATPEFPLSFLAPGTENDYVAYSIPNHGLVPHRTVESDYVMLPSYSIGNSIDWNLRYARNARWDIVRKAMEVFDNGFVKKINDDCWSLLLGAAADRNIIVLDSDASSGQFTKRLVTLGKTVMRRNGGGNSSSLNRGKLTDIWVSVEAESDMSNWGVDQIPDIIRAEIFRTPDGKLSRLFDVNIHTLDELGESQEYQLFYTNELGGSLPAGDVEIALGLDLTHKDSFVMANRGGVEVFDDPSLHRMQKAGVYGWLNDLSLGVLDNRRVLLMSF